ncbi:MAG: helix-turn-helix transcriptional regulator [Terriglobales bacterium]|jgi:transcriptional regulator with XRE-family HTH domain
MGEVIVYAEPEAKNEAAQFVTSLGGHPESRSLYSEIRSSLEKTKGLMIYLKGNEPLGTVRNRLRQVSRQHAPKTVVFTVHANQEKAAELGRIVGELQSRRIFICFNSEDVVTVLGLPGSGKTHLLLDAVMSAAAHNRVSALRKELELTQADVANAIGVSARTVQNWEAKGHTPARKLRDLQELQELVQGYIDPANISKWMDAPSEAFRGLTPRELIRQGKTRDLILEFRRMQTGEPL